MFTSINFLDHSKNLTTSINMFNGTANRGQLSVVFFINSGQFWFVLSFNRYLTVGVNFANPLITRIRQQSCRGMNPHATVFKHFEIMNLAFFTVNI